MSKFAVAAARCGVCESATGEWLDNAVHVGRAEPPVLVIATRNLAGARVASRALGAVENDRFLVEADDRLCRIKAAGVEPQHVLHPRDELGIEVRYAPHFF